MKSLLFLFLTVFVLSSCEDKPEKFSGSPEGKATVIDIVGVVSTEETVICTAQSFKFTATITRSFSSDVTVEASIVGANTSTRRAKVVIPAGQTSIIGTILAPTAVDSDSRTATFTQTATLSLTAFLPLELPTNTIYKITSNKVILNLGDSGVLLANSDRLIVRFDWKGPWGENNNVLNNDCDMVVKKDGVVFNTAVPPITTNNQVQNTSTTKVRYETFRILNSFPAGLYTFETFCKSLITSGDLNCRFILVYPTDVTKTIEYVEPALSTSSLPSVPIVRLKIQKDGVGAASTYTRVL